MDVVSENVRESNHATTMAPAATHDERIRPGAAREGNATAVTDSSTEGITTTDIRKRQRRIDAYVTAKEKVEELSEKNSDVWIKEYEKFNKWLRDYTAEVLVEYEGDKRIRTHALYPKVIAVRFLDLRLKHGVGDPVKEYWETIRKCLEARGFTRGVINAFAASKRIMSHEMLALCDCNVDKISSFRDFEKLFENVQKKEEAVSVTRFNKYPLTIVVENVE